MISKLYAAHQEGKKNVGIDLTVSETDLKLSKALT